MRGYYKQALTFEHQIVLNIRLRLSTVFLTKYVSQ
jgi:hypothetical protein